MCLICTPPDCYNVELILPKYCSKCASKEKKKMEQLSGRGWNHDNYIVRPSLTSQPSCATH